MLTKKVKNRILFLTSIFILSLFVIFFIIKTLNENLLYFRTPTDINKNQEIKVGQKMRLGGMVKKNSIVTDQNEIKFIITDFNNEIIVSYKGSIPNLFSEGKGVVAEGRLKDKKYFIASKILAKHDENYMPIKLERDQNKNVK
jgi:cytochrome c-type biogenesis protein CcmE|tara:strand:+ start:290 stop:718 length:429 start_codon:yes stop_codon:yes gene_type:complete